MTFSRHTKTVQYRHEPFDFTKKQIRLIKLRTPLDPSGAIHCDLKIFDLANAPPFTALSYRWGRATPRFHITIDGQQLEVWSNLYSFLSAFRKLQRANEYLWIDQICIDQTNTLEKNHQVQLMSDIYSRADNVVIWLGDGSKRRPWKYSEAARLFNNHPDIRWLTMFVSDEYFERIWIVQEVLSAKRIRVLIGDTWIGWEAMCKVTYSSLMQLNMEIPQSTRRLLQMSTDPQGKHKRLQMRSLVDVLGTFGGNKCSDTRDRVYGLMGLVASAERLRVDYTESPQQVCMDVVMAFCFSYTGQPLHMPSPSMRIRPDYKSVLDKFVPAMGFSAPQTSSLKSFLSVLWKRKRLGRFEGRPCPITAMGFEAGASHTTDRWWYEMRDQRYHVECKSSLIKRRVSYPLNVDWKTFR